MDCCMNMYECCWAEALLSTDWHFSAKFQMRNGGGEQRWEERVRRRQKENARHPTNNRLSERRLNDQSYHQIHNNNNNNNGRPTVLLRVARVHFLCDTARNYFKPHKQLIESRIASNHKTICPSRDRWVKTAFFLFDVISVCAVRGVAQEKSSQFTVL